MHTSTSTLPAHAVGQCWAVSGPPSTIPALEHTRADPGNPVPDRRCNTGQLTGLTRYSPWPPPSPARGKSPSQSRCEIGLALNLQMPSSSRWCRTVAFIPGQALLVQCPGHNTNNKLVFRPDEGIIRPSQHQRGPGSDASRPPRTRYPIRAEGSNPGPTLRPSPWPGPDATPPPRYRQGWRRCPRSHIRPWPASPLPSRAP